MADERRSRSTSQGDFLRYSQDALADVPDPRDRIYAPRLQSLLPRIVPWEDRAAWWHGGRIRDQGDRPSCVGHALAAAIDHLRAKAAVDVESAEGAQPRKHDRPYVSWRMLYETARFHDEWAGESYSGSSLRGGLKGFFYNGVCSIEEELEAERQADGRPDRTDPNKVSGWYMSRALLESARTVQLGAYYRVLPRLPDMHAAIAETGVIVASARTHDGWSRLAGDRIAFTEGAGPVGPRGGSLHAFAIVGYDEEGFWVQNSWGRGWGKGGLASWTYSDWAANACDAWVLQLAVAPKLPRTGHSAILVAHGAGISIDETHFSGSSQVDFSGPSRLDVVGHLIPFRDSYLDRYGPYNTNEATLRQTADLIDRRLVDTPGGRKLAEPAELLATEAYKYRDVLVYILGGWPNEHRLAYQLRKIIPTFKAMGVYPLFVAWETSLFDELHRLTQRAIDEICAGVVGASPMRRLVRDKRIVGKLAGPANRLLREIRLGARQLLVYEQPDPDLMSDDEEGEPGSGALCLEGLFEQLGRRYRRNRIRFHFAAHGFGAQLLAECLDWRTTTGSNLPVIDTCTLISPLVAVERAQASILPALRRKATPRRPGQHHGGEPFQRQSRRSGLDQLDIGHLQVVNMSPRSMRSDRFAAGYGASWPELWSRIMFNDLNLTQSMMRLAKPTANVHIERSGAYDISEWRMLGIDRHASQTLFQAIDDGCSLDYSWAARHDASEDHSLHHDLGLHPRILEMLVRRRAGAMVPLPRFHTRDPRLLDIEPAERNFEDRTGEHGS